MLCAFLRYDLRGLTGCKISSDFHVVTLCYFRNLVGEDADVETGLMSLKEVGFINYYGLQRFGTQSVCTHHVGRSGLVWLWLCVSSGMAVAVYVVCQCIVWDTACTHHVGRAGLVWLWLCVLSVSV